MSGRKYKPVEVSSVCLGCAQPFTYLHSTGMRRKHCSEACRAEWKAAKAVERKALYPKCSIPGCESNAVRVGAGMCEKHYGRMRRGAPMGERQPAYQYVTQAGYVSLFRPDHPLSGKDGRVTEHRVKAYEKHHGVCPDCFWCGASLTWESAVIDHLNEDKQDNSLENLAVACNPCNRARGALLPFVAGIRDEALLVFFDRIVEYRKARSIVKKREEAKG